MTYRHVDPPPQLDYGPRGVAPLAICWHMAEGLNVAAYLARNPLRGVSVNGVIEINGEIVTMVPWSHVAGSLNPNLAGPRENGLRQDDDDPGSLGAAGGDPDGFYGATVAKQLLGAGWRDPNRYVIAFEMAGRAVDGPNEKQVAAMVEITAQLRAWFPSLRGNLGHRDFQHVKRCPGRFIPWPALGGHGLFGSAQAQEARPVATIGYDKALPQVCTVLKGAHLYDYPDQPGTVPTTSEERDEDYLGTTPDGRFHLVSAVIDAVKRTAYISKGAMKGLPRPVPAGNVPDPRAEARGRATGYNEAITEEQTWALARKPREVPA